MSIFSCVRLDLTSKCLAEPHSEVDLSARDSRSVPWLLKQEGSRLISETADNTWTSQSWRTLTKLIIHSGG